MRMRRISLRKTLLWLELGLLYGAVPLALWLRWMPPAYVIFGAVGYIGVIIGVQKWRHIRRPLLPRAKVRYQEEIARVAKHFAVIAPALVMLTLLFVPERAFRFPEELTRVWALLMITYPVFSVLPQELIYRAFFFWRYRSLVRRPALFAGLNALAFALAHLFMGHWLSVALTAVAGLLFAYTYLRTRTLHLVWLEHALYGNLLFTIGLGSFFTAAGI